MQTLITSSIYKGDENDMVLLKIEIYITRLLVYIYKNLTFLPLFIRNKLLRYISRKTVGITETMHKRNLL